MGREVGLASSQTDRPFGRHFPGKESRPRFASDGSPRWTITTSGPSLLGEGQSASLRLRWIAPSDPRFSGKASQPPSASDESSRWIFTSRRRNVPRFHLRKSWANYFRLCFDYRDQDMGLLALVVKCKVLRYREPWPILAERTHPIVCLVKGTQLGRSHWWDVRSRCCPNVLTYWKPWLAYIHFYSHFYSYSNEWFLHNILCSIKTSWTN